MTFHRDEQFYEFLKFPFKERRNTEKILCVFLMLAYSSLRARNLIKMHEPIIDQQKSFVKIKSVYSDLAQQIRDSLYRAGLVAADGFYP